MRLGSIANKSGYNIQILGPPEVMDYRYPMIDNFRTIIEMSNYAIAKLLGVGHVVVSIGCRKLGIAPDIKSGYRLSQDEWDLIDNLLSTTHMLNVAIAQQGGIKQSTAIRRRKKLGIGLQC